MILLEPVGLDIRDVSIGGFLADAGSLYDAEKVLLQCSLMCATSDALSQLLQHLDCCIRYNTDNLH